MKKLFTLFFLFCLHISAQVDYDSQIQPIFNANCISCHSAGAAYTGGIELISYDALMAVGYNTDNTNVLDTLEAYVVTGYMPAWGSAPLSN